MHASVHLCSGWGRYFKVEEAMGRTPRVEYAGALYHVMCRGNRRETIFEDEQDCCLFLETLAEVCARTGWEVCAYVLMPNHYHLVLHTFDSNFFNGKINIKNNISSEGGPLPHDQYYVDSDINVEAGTALQIDAENSGPSAPTYRVENVYFDNCSVTGGVSILEGSGVTGL